MAWVKGSRMGSIDGEWKAWLTVRVFVLRPLAAQVALIRATRSAGPEMAVLVGVLRAAMLTWPWCSARSWSSSSGVAVMVAMAPPSGSWPMRVARAATRWEASGRAKTAAVLVGWGQGGGRGGRGGAGGRGAKGPRGGGGGFLRSGVGKGRKTPPRPHRR